MILVERLDLPLRLFFWLLSGQLAGVVIGWVLGLVTAVVGLQIAHRHALERDNINWERSADAERRMIAELAPQWEPPITGGLTVQRVVALFHWSEGKARIRLAECVKQGVLFENSQMGYFQAIADVPGEVTAGKEEP